MAVVSSLRVPTLFEIASNIFLLRTLAFQTGAFTRGGLESEL
jgi:hypothetical protein